MAKKAGEVSWNKEQEQAIRFGEGPLMIIAGAGTGKTTVITERIKHLISSGLAKPDEVLALTFTEKASREMEERVDRALPYGVTQMWISTFHAFCDRIIRNEGLSVGMDPNFRLLSEADAVQFFTSHLFEFDLKFYRPLGNPTKFVSGILHHISRLKDEDISPEDYARWAAEGKTHAETPEQEEAASLSMELASCYRQYESLKTASGLLDYGDLLVAAVGIFRKRPSILEQYRERFRYILIDEFQDTNWVQNELAVLLAGKKKNITVVGDDDQAIYRWRGAAVSNMLEFRKRFPETRTIVLTKNYRSTEEILSRSYELIQHNNPDRLEPAVGIEKRLECTRRTNGKPIVRIGRARSEDEALAVAKEIKRLSELKDKPFKFGEMAILVRANAHAEPFVRALSHLGVPHQFLGPGRLFRQPEVKDLIAYLQTLYDINDATAWFRVLSMEHFAISPRDIATLISWGRSTGSGLFSACEQAVSDGEQRPQVTPDTEKKLAQLVGMVHRHLSAVRNESAGQILYYFLSESGLLKTYAAYDSPYQERAATNVAKFFDKLKTYESDHEDASVYAVVDWLNLCMDLGESPLASDNDWSENDAVNIMTVHSAKGLEFPVVFLVNLVSQRFPSTEKREQLPVPDALIKETLPSGDAHLEEERRLFYVGMTRARDLLYLTAAKYYGEGKREKKESPFIAEALGEGIGWEAQAKESQQSELPFLADWAPHPVAPEKRETVRLANLSYSQYETFGRCPLQYRYRYVLHIPVPPSPVLEFGSAVHAALKDYYAQHPRPGGPDPLLAAYEQAWKQGVYRNKTYEQQMFDRGKALLSSYYETVKGDRTETVAVEQPFRIRIEDGLSMDGRIDRIDRLPDGRLEIIDYKTGTSPKRRDPEDDMQLTVYALAASEGGLQKDPDKVLVSFYFIEDNTKVSATRTAQQLADAKKKLAETAQAIRSSDFPPTPGKVCDFCQFRMICEAWK